LAEELKKFNVEEMLIIRKTNEQINEKVLEFEKNWNQINSSYNTKKTQLERSKRNEEKQNFDLNLKESKDSRDYDENFS